MLGPLLHTKQMNGSRYRLYMEGLPVLEDLHDLADHVHLSAGLLYRLSKYNDHFYKSFQMPKKDHGFRIIFSPSKEMKAVQAWILRNILERVHVAESATGFRKGKNTLDNARRHKDNRYFLFLDIEDFFPSIPYSKVYTVFRTIGYTPHISHILASLCTCKQRLPQGAVTSPALSNIICMRLDHRISGYVGKRNVTYTRYADDMVFSSLSPRWLPGVMRFVIRVLREEGFEPNEAKTRISGPRRQRKVTGLVISDKSLGVGRKRKRILRAALHHLVAAKLSNIERDRLRRHIAGWLAYMNSVDRSGLGQLQLYGQRLLERYEVEDSIEALLK